MIKRKLEIIASGVCAKLALINRHMAEHRGNDHNVSLDLFDEEIRQVIIDGLNEAYDLARQPVPLEEMTTEDIHAIEANLHQILKWARRNVLVLPLARASRIKSRGLPQRQA
jgi:hypothetical protein